VHRPADPAAHHDHVHALLSRPVVDVHVEHALVQIGCRVLDLPQVEPDEVGEPGVHGEDPGEVVVQVDLAVPYTLSGAAYEGVARLYWMVTLRSLP
jgi:hypothetical protein